MALTQADLDQRLKFVGASEAAAILGLDPWRTAADIWALKTGRVESGAAGDAADLGIRLEPVVLDWAAELLGPLDRNRRIIRDDLRLGATFDALTQYSEPVEAKTSGLLSLRTEDWGDAGTDEVPERVIIQAHVQMILAEANVCHVPTLLGGRGLVMYQVEINVELAKMLAETIPAWWDRFVATDTPPDDSTPSISILKRYKRVPEKVAEIDPQLARDYQHYAQCVKDAEALKEDAQAKLLAAMGDAEAADFGDAEKLFTYAETKTNRFAVAEFKAANPELHREFCRESAFRSLRLVRKPKAPKTKGSQQ